MSVEQNVHESLVDDEYLAAPHLYRRAFRDAIRKRRVVKGMWPTEALLAAGGGVYRVKADPSKWVKGTNPMQVILAQCTHPDNSLIEIVFQNFYQFPCGTLKKFTACFENGLVTEIKEN